MGIWDFGFPVLHFFSGYMTIGYMIIGFWVSVLHFTVSLHLHGYMGFWLSCSSLLSSEYMILGTWVYGLLTYLFFTFSWLYGLMGYYSSLHRVLGFCFSLKVSLYLYGYMSLVVFLKVQGF